ncbi:hypothetical protein GCM10010342_41320 [Streptomyces anulatus]|nr:hypothetical protein GCM10010342_41320 [Streptomyces anulatus]
MAPGNREHDDGGARDAQPDHVQRVETRLDQRLGRHSRTAERKGRDQCEAQSGTSALKSRRRLHRHIMAAVDSTVIPVTPVETALRPRPGEGTYASPVTERLTRVARHRP